MSERPIINLGRYRNFRFSIPFDQFQIHREQLISTIRSRARYFHAQEEISDGDFHHMECFINTKNSCSAISLSKALGIKYCYGVQLSGVEREMDYCSKLDTRIENGLILSIGVPPTNNKTAQSIYKELLTFDNAEDAMSFLRENDPQTYVLKRAAIESCLTRECRKRIAPAHVNFSIPFINVNDDKCHIFVGPTGIGKTNFAMAHFQNPVIISDRQDFSKIDSLTDGFILDDFSTRAWLSSNVLHIVDCAIDRSINVKYGVATIPAHLPRIITTNDISLFWPHDILMATKLAIERRIVIHNFTDGSIFKKQKLSDTSILDIPAPVTDSVTDLCTAFQDTNSRSSLPFLSIYSYAQDPIYSNAPIKKNYQALPVDLDDIVISEILAAAQSTPKSASNKSNRLVNYSDSMSNLSLPPDLFIGIDV